MRLPGNNDAIVNVAGRSTLDPIARIEASKLSSGNKEFFI